MWMFVSARCTWYICLCCLQPGRFWICFRHLLRPSLSDPCSQAWHEGADNGTDGSWNTSRRRKGRLLWPTKETHCKVKMPWERIFCQWFEPSLKSLLTSAGLQGFLPPLERVLWSLFYVLPATAEPNAIFHPLKNEQWVETEIQQSFLIEEKVIIVNCVGVNNTWLMIRYCSAAGRQS